MKKILSFTCPHCGAQVHPIKKNGLHQRRLHCPNCLWAVHTCNGLSEPRGIVLSHKGYVLIFHCLECGTVTSEKAAPDDDFEKLLELSQFNAI